jgi:hypothetical protein
MLLDRPGPPVAERQGGSETVGARSAPLIHKRHVRQYGAQLTAKCGKEACQRLGHRFGSSNFGTYPAQLPGDGRTAGHTRHHKIGP